MRSARRQVLVGVFRTPAVLALLSAFGLMAGLLGDGIWDDIACVALGVPMVLLVWHTMIARPHRHHR